MKCPYCAEEIQAEAKKCKHCGEWMDGNINHSATARAVASGLKKKELDDFRFKCLAFLSAVAGVCGGFAFEWWVGVVIFVVLIVVTIYLYWRE